MFARLLYQSFFRQRRRKLLAGISVMLGMTVATAMIAVGTDIGDKINKELRVYGANLIIYPQEDTLDVEIAGVNLKPASDGAYLDETELQKIKHIFWGLNILGYSPMLPVPVAVAGSSEPVELIGTYFAKAIPIRDDIFVTGVRKTHPWWKVHGVWPQDDSGGILLGSRLAQKLNLKTGDVLRFSGRQAAVKGVLTTGGPEEDAIIAPLPMAQELIGRPGAVRRVYVSALTIPEDDFARRDPRSMSPAMLDRWTCSPYANSIAYQINQALPGAHAEQIRRVAQNEGTVLSRISGLMLLITLAALGAAALAISAAMTTTILERRREIGLMKSLGANNSAVAALFLTEASLLAIAGGLIGFGLGNIMAQRIGMAIFNTHISVQPVLLPVILLLSLAVTFAGSAASIRRAVKLEPAVVLRGDAA